MRRLAAAAGIFGPIVFASVLVGLTVIQYPFMRSIGWDPVRRPTFDWPSGLALGPIGWIMTATFLLSGILLSIFAWGLREELKDRSGQIGTMILMWAGVAMMGLAFTTDGTLAGLPPTWHGRLHDLAFLTLGLMLIPGMILLSLSFHHSPRWRRLAPFTWITIALAIPTFAFKGIVFYGFLGTMLAWNVATAVQLWAS